MRIATYNAELFRDGPGLLLRDILKGEDPQIIAAQRVISDNAPDILVLQGVDYDLEGAALGALADALGTSSVTYPYRFALPPNAGRQSGVDLDGDDQLGGPRDAHGYGRFFGQGAMAILSRYPILTDDVQDYTALLWRDLPDARLPMTADGPFPSAWAQQVQRLSSHGHWVVPISLPDQSTLTLMTFYATPPVFDGPEDRNGLRNHDEILFWPAYLAGAFGMPPTDSFVIAGGANLDPEKGDGIKSAIRALLDHPLLQDPLPGRPTVIFEGLGPMRVDYLLPSRDWQVRNAGIATDPAASRHGLVWVDLDR